jgi:NitT/TauT family transport system permease protein
MSLTAREPLGQLLQRNIAKAAAPAASQGRARRLRREREWPPVVPGLTQFLIVIAILAIWEVGARSGFIDGFFWSYPSAIYKSGEIFVTKGDAFVDTWFTLKATILGFIIGTGGGAIIGLAFWWSRNWAKVFQPFLIVFHAIPKFALGPLVVLVFGIGLASKVAMAVALTIVVSALAAYSGVIAVDRDSENLMYSLGASRWQVFRKLVVPSVLPWIAASLRVNIGLAMAGAIVGEFISSQHGLGRTIMYAGQTFDVPLIWVGTTILSILAVAIYAIVGIVEKSLLKGVLKR